MYKNISSHKNVDLFSSVFKKIIANNTTITYQEVGEVTQSHIFCQRHKNFSMYHINLHKLIVFYSQGILILLFSTVSSWNGPERQLIAKLILPHE